MIEATHQHVHRVTFDARTAPYVVINAGIDQDYGNRMRRIRRNNRLLFVGYVAGLLSLVSIVAHYA